MRKLLFILICFMLLIATDYAQSVQAGPPPTIGYMKLFREINESKGKVVLINFFATWCVPCQQEIPGLMSLRKLYPEQEIRMIGVSMDTDYGQLRAYLEKTPVNYTVYHADAQVAQIFQVSSLPKMLVYDQKGSLVVDHSGFVAPEQLKQVLDKLVADGDTAGNTDQMTASPQQAAAQGNQ